MLETMPTKDPKPIRRLRTPPAQSEIRSDSANPQAVSVKTSPQSGRQRSRDDSIL